MTPEQEADSKELADILENAILEWTEKRKGQNSLDEIFEALLSLMTGRLAFIDSAFELYCLDKYCPLPPEKTYYD